ncbi:MAG: S1C family serine protease [Pseudomonadota bacterium]
MGALVLSWSAVAGAQSNASNILRAVVAMRAEIPEDSRTVRFLGARRTGTAILIDRSGLLLTIGYLILEAKRVEIFFDGEVREADVVAYDYRTGLGLIRTRKPIDATPLKLGDASTLTAKAPVLVAAYGGEAALRPAIVLSRRNFAGYWEYQLDDAIFTIPPYPAFAGAALLGPNGDLMGVGYLAVPNAGESENSRAGNMFVPIDVLKPVLADMIATGRSQTQDRPWMGLFSQTQNERVVVWQVIDDGPADRAGVRVGDIILGVGERPVRSLFDLYDEVWRLGEPGVTVNLFVYRESEIVQIPIESQNRYDWFSRHPSRE